MPVFDKVLVNATTLNSLGNELYHQAIAIKEGRIVWCGLEQDLPPHWSSESVEDCQQQLITPGLIDCHTHLVYAGNRANEFKLRLSGASYAELAKSGGGILSTVRATRNASKEELLIESWPRLMSLLAEGVTTVEIKSGYGLDLANEIKILQVARELEALSGMRIKTTFLGAHSVPPEFAGQPQAYVDYLCRVVLPEIAAQQLADAVDVFCESIAFNLPQTQQLFEQAVKLGLPIKCHAEQLSNLGASKLAASMGALSCDHLEFLDDSGVDKLAKHNTVAVLLPGAYYFLKEHQLPPIARLRAKQVGMAIATDCNPGSSPTSSLLLMLSMACRYFSFTIPEALSAVTTQAAKALGLERVTGIIAPGLAADLIRWSVSDSALLCYYFGTPIKHETMINGNWIDWNKTNHLFKE